MIFKKTEVAEIDKILLAIEQAFDEERDTEEWFSTRFGPPIAQTIEDAAKKAAERITRLEDAHMDLMLGGRK